MKMEIKEFVSAVKDELLCYEDMEQVAAQWEKEFYQWIEEAVKKKNKLVIHEKGRQFLKVKDEDEIFETADSYMDALEDNTKASYWKEF